MSTEWRRIIHIDMDAFYAAIEQRDDPTLVGRPIAVGGRSGRGVVMTASYEARPFGVRSAMPAMTAARLCPELVLVPPRFEVYKAVSRQIRGIFETFSDAVEPLSLDEAYLDVTLACADGTTAISIARAIKERIRAETGLTASAGVSFNKFLAKTASDLKKPDGLAVIRPHEARAFLARMPIAKFHGVGPATAKRLKAAGIVRGADLQAVALDELIERCGRHTGFLWHFARGRDERAVKPDRLRKSVSIEDTFDTDVDALEVLQARLDLLTRGLHLRLDAARFDGRTLTLKIKHADFRIRTRSRTFTDPLDTRAPLGKQAQALLVTPHPPEGPVRLLGLGVSNPIDTAPAQLELFDPGDGVTP